MSWEDRMEPCHRRTDETRTPFNIDYARIIHSASFRRLQGKTQILNLGDSDFYRTRLTHSLEVSQIANGIVEHLRAKGKQNEVPLPEQSLIQAIGCAHDLGHPPFGHGGEVALNYCMRRENNSSLSEDIGFEGNGQTLRILSKLENFSKGNGANLCRRTLLGLLKYPQKYSALHDDEIQPQLSDTSASFPIINTSLSQPPKCFLDTESDVVEWILNPLKSSDRSKFCSVKKIPSEHDKTRYKSLDCSIMDTADDIAYGIHDLEDAISLKFITKEKFSDFIFDTQNIQIFQDIKEISKENDSNVNRFISDLFTNGRARKVQIGSLVNYYIRKVTLVRNDDFSDTLLKWNVTLPDKNRSSLRLLMGLVRDKMIKNANVQQLEFKGQHMVRAVFEALQSDPCRILPEDIKERYNSSSNKKRIICDYISGMTDIYLMKTYERLFSPRMGSIFEKL